MKQINYLKKTLLAVALLLGGQVLCGQRIMCWIIPMLLKQ